MPYEVQVKEVPPQHVALVRRHTSISAIGKAVMEGFTEVGAAVGRSGLPMTGPPFLIMLDAIDEETDGDVEIAFPLARPFPGDDDVRGRELPATTVAWTLHRGPYDEIGPAYRTVTSWVAEHGHDVAGPPREVYLTDPSETPDPADFLTEVQIPIR